MRVASRGNLTVELIRLQRFGIDAPLGHHPDQIGHRCASHQAHCDRDKATIKPLNTSIDKVELSREALASDPWAAHAQHAQPVQSNTSVDQPEDPTRSIDLPPQRISPVLGSPSLAGLGTAMIVPGTLLDVVA